jgi:hypothetical protein
LIVKKDILATKEDLLKMQMDMEKRFSDMEKRFNQLTIWIVSTFTALAGIVIAVFKL